jgi:putative NADPH-quinone reductase
MRTCARGRLWQLMRKNIAKRIAIIQGHPDPKEAHFCHALAWAYEEGAVPTDIRAAQADIRWANHLFICYPLWLGTLPALLKGFFEQSFRYGFAIESGARPKRLLKGRSARIVVTMGMPAAIYRYYFRAHGLKSLESGILSLAGIGPIRATLIVMVEQRQPAYRNKWLAAIRELGSAAK